MIITSYWKVHQGLGCKISSHLEDLRACVCIKSAENVVQKVDIAVLVNSPRELHPLPLSATQVNPALPNLGLVPELHLSQILHQRTHLKSVLVLGVVHGKAEEDVILDGTLLDPWRLRYVGCSPAHVHLQVAIAESVNGLNRWRFPIASKILRE